MRRLSACCPFDGVLENCCYGIVMLGGGDQNCVCAANLLLEFPYGLGACHVQDPDCTMVVLRHRLPQELRLVGAVALPLLAARCCKSSSGHYQISRESRPS